MKSAGCTVSHVRIVWLVSRIAKIHTSQCNQRYILICYTHHVNEHTTCDSLCTQPILGFFFAFLYFRWSNFYCNINYALATTMFSHKQSALAHVILRSTRPIAYLVQSIIFYISSGHSLHQICWKTSDLRFTVLSYCMRFDWSFVCTWLIVHRDRSLKSNSTKITQNKTQRLFHSVFCASICRPQWIPKTEKCQTKRTKNL